VPERLPGGVNCILAHHDSGLLVADVGYVRQRLRALTVTLGHGTTYHVEWQLEGAREQVYEVAHEVDRVRRQVYTGRCARLRKRDEYSGYISVRDREVLGDGGLRTVSGLLNKLADAMKRLRGREPFYVRARDSSLSNTRGRITAFTGQIAGALDEIAVDLSAADVSGRTDLDPTCFANVIWSARTVWPPSLLGLVRANSRPLCRDAFQVVAITTT
jgi:hypothetical protein